MMKKRQCWSWLLFFSLLLGGCSLPGMGPAAEDLSKAASQFAEARLSREEQSLRNTLTTVRRSQVAEILGPLNPHWVGYQIGAVDTEQKTVTVRWQETYSDRSYTRVYQSRLKLKKEEGQWRVDGIEDLTPDWLVTARDIALVLQQKGGQARTLLSLEQLPNVASPLGAEPGTEFGVGREGFGPLALRPDGKELALSTRGLHAFIALLPTEAAARPALKPLDLYFEGGVAALAWSPEGKYLAANLDTPAGTRRLVIYEPGVKKVLKTPFDEQFPWTNYDLNFLYWLPTGPELYFRVTAAQGTVPQQGAEGIWKWSLATGKLEQVKK
ncbi:hypothetical protein CTH_2111 [Carboxydocella thermautotrophica]|nr:hypothetical protein CTH_2111 [Carboxydocella thermautotrophica]